MEDKNQIVTILFERKVLKNIDGTILYTYLPLGVLLGIEEEFNNTKIFSCDSQNMKSLTISEDYYNEEEDNYVFNYIDDICTMNDKYVYGFSIIVTNQNSKEIKKTINYVNNNLEEIKKNTIYHIFKENEGALKLFVIVGDLNINISADNFYELQDILFGEYDPYVDDIKALVLENKERISKPSVMTETPRKILYSNEIYDKVSKTVICQDEQIKTIASALAKNSRLDKPSLKSNMLICGPTGVGKSEIFRSISENFDIAIAFEDSNEYTAASYKGKDVTEMLVHLFENADCDIDRAQRGILIIDEIDKKAGNEHETFKSAVINSLLKMMEGHTYNIETRTGEFDFDTSLLTFAFLGAFSGIEKLSSKRKSMGFMTEEDKEEQDDVKNHYSNDTLKKYGLLPEFIGRCDTIVTMNSLKTDDFIKIINTSNRSQLLLYKELFQTLGINFIYDDKTIEAIAKKANSLGLGARSIKKIVENALYIANYELFSKNNYSELIISPETIEDNTQYILR